MFALFFIRLSVLTRDFDILNVALQVILQQSKHNYLTKTFILLSQIKQCAIHVV